MRFGTFICNELLFDIYHAILFMNNKIIIIIIMYVLITKKADIQFTVYNVYIEIYDLS